MKEQSGSRKRRISVGSPEGGQKKKLDSRSEHEKRLTGDYSIPKTAQKIGYLTWVGSDEGEDSPAVKIMAQKPHVRGAHRPRNTLGDSRHAANSRKPDNTRFLTEYANQNEIKKPGLNRPLTEAVKSRASNTRPPILVGDGFDDSERTTGIRTLHTSNKRRKLDVESRKGLESNTPVDLTKDDDVQVVGLNGKALPGSEKSSQKGVVVADRPPQLFDTAEFAKVSAITEIAPKKRSRRSRDGRGSSQASSYGTPVNGISTHASTDGLTTNPVLAQELLDDRKREESHDWIPINLDKGMNEIGNSSNKVVTKNYQAMLDNISQVSHMPTDSRALLELSQSQNAGRSHRDTKQSGTYQGSARLAQQPAPEDVRHKFQRDDEPAAPRQRARARMKTTSHAAGVRVSPTKDDSESDDVLAGETTVGSQPSRSNSPQKKTTTTRDRRLSNSPGALPPTVFRKGGRDSKPADLRAGSRLETTESYHDADRASIRAFFSTSCIVTSGELRLRYDSREKQFDLYRDDVLQVLRGKQKTVSISKSEVHTFKYSRNSSRVYLQGPSVEGSNGHICIEFLDSGAVKWFHDLLLEATNDHLTTKGFSDEGLNKIFTHQTKLIQAEYDRQSARHSSNESTTMTRSQQEQDDEDEQIKYEPDEPLRIVKPSTARARLNGEVEALRKSAYFQEPQSRRSSRQTRQIKQPSPSPEPIRKWTQQNKPSRWNHPVVYPSEGLRRVTVDFQDLKHLDEGEMLNDNIISFALRRIEENIAPEHKEDVFFFNSFFYSALTHKNGHKAFNYDAVKRWTKNQDLLTLPYIVVPININCHWFVVIICNLPLLSRKHAGIDDVDEEHEDEESGVQEADPPDALNPVMKIETNEVGAMLFEDPGYTCPDPNPAPSSRTLTDGVDAEEIKAQTTAMSQMSLSQEEGDAKLHPTNDDIHDGTLDSPEVEIIAKSKGKLVGPKKNRKKVPPPPKKYDPDLPTIVTLDSLGYSHATETRNLKDYLKAEAEAKRSMELDTKELQGMTAKGIPEQTNFCDCGLYLVGYVEQFAKNPREFITKVLTRQLDKQADFACFDPSAKRDEIRDELLNLSKEQDAAHKAKKSTKKTNAKGLTDAAVSSPTPAPAKHSKPQEPWGVASEGTSSAETNAAPKQEPQTASPMYGPEALVDAAEDDEMEVAVPRAFKGAARHPAAAEYDVKKHLHAPGLLRESEAKRQNGGTHQHESESSPTALRQIYERMASNDSEEMLDHTDAPIENSPIARSYAPSQEVSSDLLQPLENALKLKQEQLRKHPAERNSVLDTSAPSRGKIKQVRGIRAGAKPKQVSVLENDDSTLLEVEESPDESQESL